MNNTFKFGFLAAAVIAANAHSQTSSVTAEVECSTAEEKTIVFSYDVDLDGVCEVTQTRTIDGEQVIDTFTISSNSSTSYSFEESAEGQTDLTCTGESVTLTHSAAAACGEGAGVDVEDPSAEPTPGSSSNSSCVLNGEEVPCDDILNNLGDLPGDFGDLPALPVPTPGATPGSFSSSSCSVNGEEVPCGEIPDFDFPELPNFNAQDDSVNDSVDTSTDMNCSINGEEVPCGDVPDFQIPDLPGGGTFSNSTCIVNGEEVPCES